MNWKNHSSMINITLFILELQFELMMNGDDEQIKRVKEIMDR